MRKLITLLAVAALMAVAVPAFGGHVSDGGTDETWTNEMNQESYWEARFGPGADCTKFADHSGFIPAQYDAAVVKDGNEVRVYEKSGPFTALGAVNPANGQHFAAPHSWVMKCTVDDVPEVDLCDPTQKPSGSIADWLADNDFEAADCFEFEAGQECGTLDVELTRNDTPFNYLFVWNYGTTPDLDTAQGFPAVFGEDENGGTVEVTYYVVGPEKDYFVGYGIPNFWDGGATVTVDTDCETPETTTTTVQETTTTEQETTTTTVEESTTTTVGESTTTTVQATPPATVVKATELPFTGPGDWLLLLLPVGLVLFAVGGLLAYRFRDRLNA